MSPAETRNLPFLAKCWPSPAPNQHRAFSSHLLGLAVRKSQCCLATIAAATVSITVLATTAASTVIIAFLAITAASATVDIVFLATTAAATVTNTATVYIAVLIVTNSAITAVAIIAAVAADAMLLFHVYWRRG